MEEFEYSSLNSYEENFETWYYLNTKEKEIFKNRLAHSIKINADGVLEDVLVLEK